MRKHLLRIKLLLLSASFACCAHAAEPAYKDGDRLHGAPKVDAGGYTLIEWDALIPKDWDPTKEFKRMNLYALDDGDPRAMEALEKMKQMWDEAPTTDAYNGKRVRLPGFIVPLEQGRGGISEFLLVPYFGACIHTPPPPANQIIHVSAAKYVKGIRSMDPVWVSGVLQTGRSESAMGNAGYQLNADVVLPYVYKK
jgi:hypothetical protein